MVTNFQYIATCLAFSKGKPFRKSFYTNALYTVSVVALVVFSGVIVMVPLKPKGWLYWSFLNMLPIPAWYRFGYVCTGIALNTLMTFVVEYFIIATCV
jgi:cation-transporting ATPase 13A3/4/5